MGSIFARTERPQILRSLYPKTLYVPDRRSPSASTDRTHELAFTLFASSHEDYLTNRQQDDGEAEDSVPQIAPHLREREGPVPTCCPDGPSFPLSTEVPVPSERQP